MTSSFDRAFAITVGHEGGYSCEPYDHGNWTGGEANAGVLRGTKYGISAAAYPLLDIAGLTMADASEIYRHDYWARISGDQLPAALAILVFDAAVNNGVSRAVQWLQIAAGVLADGAIGPATLAAANQPGIAVQVEFMAQRMNFMAHLPAWPAFGLGWARRLCRLPYQAAL